MKRKLEFIIHIIFWIFYGFTLIFPLVFSTKPIIPNYVYWFIGNTVLMQLLNFYLFYTFITPLFIKKQKVKFWLIAGGFIVVFPILRFLIVKYIYTHTDFPGVYEGYNTGLLVHEFLSTILITGFSIFIKIFIDWQKNQKTRTELINQNQASELAMLRNQINPHFLFNTLNNIYYLVFQKSEAAPSAVMKLSEIMRYMLYDANTDKVTLDKEIEYLKGFIELQNLRSKQPNFVQFTVEGKPEGILVPPMLIIPFIENAFKHGSKKHESPGIIVDLKIDKDHVLFYIKNYLANEISQNKDKIGGIGLANVKRRLEILYPNKHILIRNKTKDTFVVKLTLAI